MRCAKFFLVALVAISAEIRVGAEEAVPTGKIEMPAFTLNPEPGVAVKGGEKPFPLVLAWLAQNAPECPAAAAPEIAVKFIDQLSLRHPGEADRLTAGEVPLKQYESLLWQTTAAGLKGAAYEVAREAFAIRRVGVIALQQGEMDPKRGGTVVNHLKNESPVAYRRLVEGRMEDEEVLRLPGLLPEREAARAAALKTATTQPREVTAQDIVGEYARRNQTGSALPRLQSFVLKADIKLAGGAAQQIVLSKMRPDRVRLVTLKDGVIQYTLAGVDADHFWLQQLGQPPAYALGKDLGAKRYLAEFADPLLVGEGYVFERLPDGADAAGKPCYRINVRRPDGSTYVARIDAGSYHQTGREESDHSTTVYSDFREIAGITFAFREELTDSQGRPVAVASVREILPNPGLIETYFKPARDPGDDYYRLEQLASAAFASAAPK